MSQEELREKIGHFAPILDEYVETGYFGGGHFITAVLENNLMQAHNHADTFSLSILHHLVVYMYNYVPSSCYGSRKKMDKWIKIGGMEGLDKLELEKQKKKIEEKE